MIKINGFSNLSLDNKVTAAFFIDAEIEFLWDSERILPCAFSDIFKCVSFEFGFNSQDIKCPPNENPFSNSRLQNLHFLGKCKFFLFSLDL